MEGDEGTYTCIVMVLGADTSESVEIGQLTGKYIKHSSIIFINHLPCCSIPIPNVTFTAPSTQIEAQPLTLQCSVTTVRGITSRVDIL